MSPMTPKATVSLIPKEKLLAIVAQTNISDKDFALVTNLLDAYREAAVKDAVMAERERCAKVCEGFIENWGCDDDLDVANDHYKQCANAIRTDPPGTVRGEGRVMERYDLLHIYAQMHWHCEARIVGTSSALAELRDALDTAIRNGSSQATGMVKDGEGYEVLIECDDSEWQGPQWMGRPSPYTDLPTDPDSPSRLASDLKAKDSENVSLTQRVQELERALRMAHD